MSSSGRVGGSWSERSRAWMAGFLKVGFDAKIAGWSPGRGVGRRVRGWEGNLG